MCGLSARAAQGLLPPSEPNHVSFTVSRPLVINVTAHQLNLYDPLATASMYCLFWSFCCSINQRFALAVMGWTAEDFINAARADQQICKCVDSRRVMMKRSAKWIMNLFAAVVVWAVRIGFVMSDTLCSLVGVRCKLVQSVKFSFQRSVFKISYASHRNWTVNPSHC